MSNESSYFIVIPGPVRIDPRLNAEQKMLYGELSSKCWATGYCWATNKRLCDLMGCTERTLQRNLKVLSDCNHIKIEILKDDRGTLRHIWLVDGREARSPADIVAPAPHLEENVPAKNGGHNTLKENNKGNKESSAQSRGGVVTPVKKETAKVKVEPAPRPHWRARVDTWHTDYQGKKNGEVPTIAGINLKHFANIYDLLQARAKRQRKEWTCELATSSLRFFLNAAYTDAWLKDHWLLENLFKQFDAVYAREALKFRETKKAGPPATNEGPSAHIKYLFERYKEGNLDERVIDPTYYDHMLGLGLVTPEYFQQFTGDTIDLQKRAAVVAWLKYQTAKP